jgi:hypothetical protein
MIIPGKVINGVVVLPAGSSVPEGADVSISYDAPPQARPDVPKKRVQVPLVHTGKPGTVNLTSERLAEILDEKDVSPRR